MQLRTTKTFQYSGKHLENVDNRSRNENNIPNDFCWKTYVNLLRTNTIVNNTNAYSHYNKYGKNHEGIFNAYWREIYNIPNTFSEISYGKYLIECGNPLIFSDNKDMYLYYVKVGSTEYPLNDVYDRCHFEIPTIFSCEVFQKYYNDILGANETNVTDVNLYYIYHTQPTIYPLDDGYLRLLYNSPDDLDCAVFKIHNKLSIGLTDEECYKMFDENRETMPLDDKYMRILYKIPTEFDCTVFSKFYGLKFINNNYCYKTYADNIKKYPLNDEYMRTRFKSPMDINCTVFKKRYSKLINSQTKDNDIYELISKKGDKFPLDEEYYDILYKKEENDLFDWKLYLETYPDRFSAESPKIGDVYKLYYEGKELMNSNGENDEYHSAVYKIPKSFVMDQYRKLHDCILPDKCDNLFVFKYYTKQINLIDIYNSYKEKNDKTKDAVDFIGRYEYIAKAAKLDETNMRELFMLKDFAASYYKSAPSKGEKVVTVKNEVKETFEEPVVKKVYRIETETKTRLKLKPKKAIVNNNLSKSRAELDAENIKAESRNKLMSILMNDTAEMDEIAISMGGELSMAGMNGNYNYDSSESEEEEEEETEYEDYEDSREICEEVTEYITKEIFKTVSTTATSLCYKIYNSDLVVNKTTSVNTILSHVRKYNYSLYLCLRYRSGIFNLDIPVIKKVSPVNANKNALFFCFEKDKPIIYDVLINNMNFLGREWSHTIVCSNDNSNYIKTIIQRLQLPISVEVLDAKNITFDEINNDLLTVDFWNKFKGDYIFVYNELVILNDKSQFILDKAISNRCNFVGASLPGEDGYSRSNGKYGFCSLRNKNYMLDILGNDYNLDILDSYNTFDTSISKSLTLSKVSEFILYTTNLKHAKGDTHLDDCSTIIDYCTQLVDTIKYKYMHSERMIVDNSKKQFRKIDAAFSIY